MGWALFVIYGVLIIFVIFTVIGEKGQRQKAIRQLAKLIQQAGGEHIQITRVRPLGAKGFWQFQITYQLNGVYERRQVQATMNAFGSFTGEFFWDKPLLTAPPPISTSKEQIISEMDAEIQRLRQELAQAEVKSPVQA